MFLPPVAGFHVPEGRIGQQINAALKQVDGRAFRPGREKEAVPLVTAGGVPEKLGGAGTAQRSRPGNALFIKAHKDHIVKPGLLINQAFLQTVLQNRTADAAL